MGPRGADSTQAAGTGSLASSPLDDLPDIIAEIGTDLRIRFANAAVLRSAGEKAPGVVGGRLADLGFGPDVADPIEDAIRACLVDGRAVTLDLRSDRPAGPTHLRVRVIARARTAGERTALVVVHDVAALDAAEELLREAAEGTPGFLSRITIDPRTEPPAAAFDYAGPGFLELTGHDPASMRALGDMTSLIHPDDVGEWLQQRVMLRGGGTGTLEYRIVRPDRTVRWVREHLRTIPQPDGTVRILSMFSDISDERESREALRVREEIEAALSEQMPGFLLRTLVRPDGAFRVEFVTDGVERVLGFTQRELVEMKDPELLVHPDDREGFLQPFRTLADATGPYTGMTRVRRRDGAIRWLSVRAVTRRMDGGDVLFDTIVVDLTERAEAQSALEAALEDVRAIEAHLPGFLFRVRCIGPAPADMTIEYAGPAMAALLAYEPADLVPPSGAARFIDPTDAAGLAGLAVTVGNVMATGVPAETHVECRLLRRDGTPLWVRGPVSARRRDDGSAVITGFFQDATERRQAEEALRNTEKLEGLRDLAGGVAHDFNNLLTVIIGNAELALQGMPAGSQASETLDEVVDAARGASDLTRQLLAYAGRSRILMGPVDVSEAVAAVADLLTASTPPGVTVETDLAAGLPAVQADAAALGRVVLNLVLNAAEAYAPKDGTVSVRTALVRIGRRELGHMTLGHEAPTGRYVILDVADRGSGMDAATKARMFDPFFSTRADGRGLGLASVLGVVREHRGTIAVTSEPGRGTTVRVALPVASERASQHRDAGPGGASSQRARGADEPAGPPAAGPRGSRVETILVVDDDASVLALGCRILRKAGFRVRGASGGAEAVASIAAEPGGTDVVVLDLSMPGMDGEATLRAIREIVPTIPVVLCTGYDDQATADRFGRLGLSGILGKPYDRHSLIAAVAAAIAGRPTLP